MSGKLLHILLALVVATSWAQAQKLVFTPQWIPQSEFAGYYAALEKGYYRELGLDVEISHPSVSITAPEKLRRGDAQIISTNLMEAMKLRNAGLPIVNIMQASAESGLMIVSHQPINNNLELLRGKRVGYWKNGHCELAKLVALEKGININWVYFLSGINLFMSGAVDATVAMSYNEYLSILETDKQLSSSQVLRLSDLGYNIPGDGIYVTERFYDQNKEQLAKFVKATKRGWLWVREHQQEAVDMVMAVVQKQKVPTNRYHQQTMLTEVLKLQCKKGEKTPSFYLSKEEYEHTCRLLSKTETLGDKLEYSQFVMPQER